MQTNDNKSKLFVDKLKKYYNEIKAVDGLSFNLYSGEIYGLLGPNGAGKTTTLKSIGEWHSHKGKQSIPSNMDNNAMKGKENNQFQVIWITINSK